MNMEHKPSREPWYSNEDALADGRQQAPAAQRNAEPILEVLKEYLPEKGLVLEVASGTGEHAVYFSKSLGPRKWLPSDFEESRLKSINAWRKAFPNVFLMRPIHLDARERPWQIDDDLRARITAIVCVNMVHVAPIEATHGLFEESGAILPAGGVLYLYGAYKKDGKHTSQSNADFDARIRAHNPTWGVRDIAEVTAIAEKQGFTLTKDIAMPANNRSLIFTKTAT